MSKIQKADSAINIFVFIKANWATIKVALWGGGGMTTLAVLESLPITAIALAAMFGAIGLIILKEKFAKKRDNRTASSAEKNEPEFTAEKLLNGLTDAFNPRDLATKLSNRDIEKLVDGTFESSKALFKFHQPRRIDIYHSWDKKNN